MWSRVNLVYLAASACVLSVYITIPRENNLIGLLIWIILPIFYPTCLVWAGTDPRFWRGLVHFWLILTIAQLFSFFVYLLWYGVLKYPVFEDKSAFMSLMESNAVESAIFFAGDLLSSWGVALVCFPAGYLVSRWLRRR